MKACRPVLVSLKSGDVASLDGGELIQFSLKGSAADGDLLEGSAPLIGREVGCLSSVQSLSVEVSHEAVAP